MEQTNRKIFAISFLMLFLEIFLIRWISTEVRIFAYVSNLVLLACFLGIGLGSCCARRESNVLVTFGMLALIAVSVQAMPFRQITDMLSGFSDSLIWYGAITSRPDLVVQGIGLTLFMFCMILAAFFPLGQILGRLLDRHPRIIAAYSINIAASLLGVWAFSCCSFFYTDPWLWFAVSLLLLFVFLPAQKSAYYAAWACAAFILLVTGVRQEGTKVLWSPYQKLEVVPATCGGVPNGFTVQVNNVGYMSVMDLSEAFFARYPGLYNPGMCAFNQYVLPYKFKESIRSVLIVGAGAGNDVAGALRSGVPRIDAVEIDPGIYTLGRKLHPEKPYQDSRVHVTVDDARAFFKKARGPYDLICFGLLDSHTLSSNYNNTRLDHYIYTQESIREARRLLADDGILSVSFAAQTQWIGDRLHGILAQEFGDVPYVVNTATYNDSYTWGTTMFLASNDPDKLRRHVAAQPDLHAYIANHTIAFGKPVRLTTDDWPYLYIEKPSIPAMYVCIMASLLILVIAAAGVLRGGAGAGFDLHFFFLGAAFLLLEFQNVSKAALVFGSTWLVNSFIISAIMLLILLANLFVSKIAIKKITPVYLLLLVSILGVYVVPLSMFNQFGYWTKSVLASLVLNLPIFFAGIIFIHSFSAAPSKHAALGSNLFGAAVGGLIEPLSFITGIRSLLLVVCALYLLSFICLRGRRVVGLSAGT